MNPFFTKLLAQLIERVFKNKVTTIAGILGAVAATLGAWTNLLPANYQPYALTSGITLSSVAAVLAHDNPKETQTQ